MEREAASILVLSRPGDASVASRFATALRDAIPAEDIRVSTSNDLERYAKSLVIDRTNIGKPLTLDSLIGTFSLEKAADTPALPAGTDGADLVILVGDDLREHPLPEMSLGSDSSDAMADDSFSEYFTPQTR
jgi:hypothetical protein